MYLRSFHPLRTDYKFTAVEAQNPYQKSVEEWKELLNSVPADQRPQFVLINSPAEVDNYLDRLPTVQEFQAMLDKTSVYVDLLGARKVHLVLFDIRGDEEL